jgi:hypothetical protein
MYELGPDAPRMVTALEATNDQGHSKLRGTALEYAAAAEEMADDAQARGDTAGAANYQRMHYSYRTLATADMADARAGINLYRHGGGGGSTVSSPAGKAGGK